MQMILLDLGVMKYTKPSFPEVGVRVDAPVRWLSKRL